MIDPKIIINEPEKVKEDLKARGMDPQLVYQFINLDREYKALLKKVERLRKNRNYLTKLIGGQID